MMTRNEASVTSQWWFRAAMVHTINVLIFEMRKRDTKEHKDIVIQFTGDSEEREDV